MNKDHVLIVDDDEKLRHLLAQYLTRFGFVITEAENPQQASEILKLFSFDAVVMDVMMPVKNGVAYTKELRQQGL
ncbi:MAG: response regulator transcription factor, partial [Alphaproteobacteria bacterium]